MAYDFNGTTAKISFGDVTFLDGLSTLSCHLWLNMDAITNTIVVEKCIGAGASGFSLLADAEEVVVNGIYVTYDDGVSGGVNANSATSSVTTAAGWQSVGFSLALTSTGLKTRVGGTAGTGANISAFVALPNNANPLMIGAHHDSTKFTDGQIAELAFWNRVLTDQEWTNLAAGQAPTLCAASGLIFYRYLLDNTTDPAIGTGTGTVTAATPTTHPSITYSDTAYLRLRRL